MGLLITTYLSVRADFIVRDNGGIDCLSIGLSPSALYIYKLL